ISSRSTSVNGLRSQLTQCSSSTVSPTIYTKINCFDRLGSRVPALAAAVRDGELIPEQRECLVSLSTPSPRRLRWRDHYPDNDSAALGYLIGTWGRRSSATSPSWL
ncbi:MAG: hypothetical protein ACRDRP_22720, partial [Pseudonocardiaceae bacterium]